MVNMEVGLGNTLLAGDPRLVDHIVGEVKSQGIFDQFRKECIADVDTKPAYQNLRTRVEGSVNSFLAKQPWKPDLNKNQLRENLRKHIHEAPYLDAGVERIVDQVVNPKVYSVFMPQIEDVVYKFLGIERPKARERNGPLGLKDLLPKDLDPVSPESDRNSLKDVSLESLDADFHETIFKSDEKSSSADRKLQTTEVTKIETTENGKVDGEGQQLEDFERKKTAANSILNNSSKSNDKAEEEEEDSPSFEPIDIMNLNESNVSNDSHLSGISELTSHRSRSPDFSIDLSRDNLDFSNQDSQLSKVSSDSRLSIITDCGYSNHASTPLPESSKEDEKSKDNFKAIREFELDKSNDVGNPEPGKNKDNAQENKDLKDARSMKYNLSSKDNSRDATDITIKDKSEAKDNKENRNKDVDLSKPRKSEGKESKSSKERDKDSKKRQGGHSSSKSEKQSKDKAKEKTDQTRDIAEKSRDSVDKIKDNVVKPKDEKDMYKEKIRELREKKELTEKEKLSKDTKDLKISKERKESSKERKDHKKDHKSSSSKSLGSSRYENKTIKNEEKSTKSADSKDIKSESKDKAKREDRRSSKDGRSKTYPISKTESSDKVEKIDGKKTSKTEKEEKKDYKVDAQKVTVKKNSKSDSQGKENDRNEKSDGKKDLNIENQTKDRKRRDDKKSKAKDDHSSLRKNPNDRRSTDRDGSNGSNGKSSQKSSSNSTDSTGKAISSNLSKESNNTSNSSSETSDGIEESQSEELKSSGELPNASSIRFVETDKTNNTSSKHLSEVGGTDEIEPRYKKIDVGSAEISLPLKKRPLYGESLDSETGEVKIKKPKFARNFHEAKKLMKIRKRMQKQKMQQIKMASKEHETKEDDQTAAQPKPSKDSEEIVTVPDEERVQIIEIPDEEYEQPYPEKQTNLILDESIIMEGQQSMHSEEWMRKFSGKESKLSEMERSIRQSLNEMISDRKLAEVDNHEQTTENSIHPEVAKQFKDQQVDSEDSKEEKLLTTELDTTVIKESSNSNKYKDPIHSDKSSRASNKDTEPLLFKEKDVQNSEPSGTINNGLRKNAPEVTALQEESREVRSSCEDITSSEENTTKKSSTPDPDDPEKESKIGSFDNFSELSVNVEERRLSESKPHEEATKSNDSAEAQDQIEKRVDKESNSEESLEGSKVPVEASASSIDDQDECLYFKADTAIYSRFTTFLETLEGEAKNLDQIIESLGGRMVSSSSQTMAPPLPKRKHSTSPLTDILLNNSNNNNVSHKTIIPSSEEDNSSTTKKRKLGRPKKQRPNASLCAPQSILNGENFVMPLSPESDVSATSEKASLHPVKEEKSRPRGSQRYSSDDLYKPRPLFSSSSRRSRRSNQA